MSKILDVLRKLGVRYNLDIDALISNYYSCLDEYYKEHGIELCRECGERMFRPVSVREGKSLLYVCSNRQCGHSFSRNLHIVKDGNVSKIGLEVKKT